MTDQDIYDVAIVGGGPAGLSAALWLARYLHTVVLIDSGDPRNWETRGVNGFLGSQGIRSPDLRGKGREEAKQFGAELVDGIVTDACRNGVEHFTLSLEDKSGIHARRILLAIGIKDVWPRIPGLSDCYGETVHVCPDCDGFEARDQKTIVVGKGRKAVGMALALANWTGELVICTNGEPPELDEQLTSKLKALNVPVLDCPITCIRSKQGEIHSIELADGMIMDCDRLYFAIGQYPADDLGAQLKCKRDPSGLIVIDDRNHTSVENVYAAGDIVPGPQLAIRAASDGAIAALAIHKSLLPEERRLD
ncbi:MAG: NAD(P)/FAD-dependent oxidoreductase [Gemmatimonadaceae bacterium]|nr:NAD(P)/FAD-dependent oxidoreductase [Gemmatimonadaceae bacterium]